MRSYRRPSTHRRTSANIPSAGLRSVGRPPLSHRLPLGKSRMVPYHALHACLLPRPEHLLSRLAAEPPPLSPASIAPLAVTSIAPAISWYTSIYLLLVELVRCFCWMLSSYLQWPRHTYLALGGDKGTKLRMRLTRKGIKVPLAPSGPCHEASADT